MIAYLRGSLMATWDKSCIVLLESGIGYELALPDHTFASLPGIGEKVEFYICLVVREDAQELFGFATFEERQAFEILTGISRVGARTALAILSVYRPDDLRRIAREGNPAALARVSGIGQKTAQHIFLELKYRIAGLPTGGDSSPMSENVSGIFGDTLAALTNLGYAEDECAPKIRQVLEKEEDLDVAGAIRQVLKALAKGKS